MNNITENKILLNWKYFFAGLLCLLFGYATMAIFNLDFLRLTASPIIILSGFILLTLSIFKTK